MTGQSTRSDSDPDTVTEAVTRTLKLNLETSARKDQLVRQAVDDWQAVADTMADYLPTFPRSRWSGRDTQLTRVAKKEAPDTRLYAHDRNAAAYKVQEAFNSWNERGQQGYHPRGEFGDGDYMRICSCCTKPKRRVEVVENDRGYGLRVKLVSGEDPLWFHISSGVYQDQYLDRLVNGEAEYGHAEIRFENDTLYCHLSLEESVEVYVPDDVETVVGVDLGEEQLYAAAVVDADGTVSDVQMKAGREFRHHRERLDRRRKQLMQKDDLRGVRAISGERLRYTEHVTNTATRELVDFVQEHEPAIIHLEDLTYYRETAEKPIHDWPFAMLQEQLSYKATDAGIPIRFVEPRNTSITCRHCEQVRPEAREGNEFHCRRCDYQVHADVNAAINLARRGRD